MTISLIGTPPGIIGNISNKRLLHFFLFGGGGAGAGNGGFAGGNGAALAFSAYLEKEDVLYMYNGIGGTAGGTSTAAIGGGGGGSSFIYADVRKTRLGSNPNGYGVNSNLLLAAVGGGGGGGIGAAISLPFVLIYLQLLDQELQNLVHLQHQNQFQLLC